MKLPDPDFRKCGGIFDKKTIKESISKLQLNTTNPNFWKDNQSAQAILKDISLFENELKMWDVLEDHYKDVESYLELLNEGEDVIEDAEDALDSFGELIEKIQIHKLLSERDDHRNAILTIHPGAGGTESQDWANMLYRLYSRWCERIGYKVKIAAALLSVFCIATALIFHTDFSNQMQFVSFMKNIALAGGFLFLVINDTKDFSLERKLSK